jgi:hypothetical protein
MGGSSGWTSLRMRKEVVGIGIETRCSHTSHFSYSKTCAIFEWYL